MIKHTPNSHVTKGPRVILLFTNNNYFASSIKKWYEYIILQNIQPHLPFLFSRCFFSDGEDSTSIKWPKYFSVVTYQILQKLLRRGKIHHPVVSSWPMKDHLHQTAEIGDFTYVNVSLPLIMGLRFHIKVTQYYENYSKTERTFFLNLSIIHNIYIYIYILWIIIYYYF